MKNAAVISVAGMIQARDNAKPGAALLNSISAPRKNDATPPTVNTPCVGANTSMTKSAIARPISASPATFTGSVADMNSNRITAMAPITPGKIAPGLLNSPMMPYMAISRSRNITSGRQISWNTRSPAVIGMSTIFALAVWSVRPPAVRPSSCFSKSGTSSAMRSMTFALRAFWAVVATLCSTADFAHSTLR